ncbi:hypothetical protein PG985_006706 [Apiospora marii]|uniref:MADS-box domain-containing protein n=1 Tax=Apiospora marii TaxID=335849 RepID=A0ABR1S8R8_9PEZI
MSSARKSRIRKKSSPSDKSRLKVMRLRRGRSLHHKVVEYGELFGLDVILIARDKTSGEYEVFEPSKTWPAIRDICKTPTIVHDSQKKADDVSENLQLELQRMEKLVKRLKVPEPPKPRCTQF